MPHIEAKEKTMTTQQQQKILDVLGDLLGKQLGCEVKFTVKEEENGKSI